MGFSVGPLLVVNAEVDSMGGVGAHDITSSVVVIEKVQAVLRQEYDVREERRRELEFLEKGGDPLEFKLSTTSSLSLQSTSVTDQQPNQFASSEAKCSFAIASSPHGDSAESSGRPVVRLLCEPDCGDNLMLFDGENESPQVDRNLALPSKCISTPSSQSSQLAVQELKSSASFNVPRNSYRRRSRPNRDGDKTTSKDAFLSRSTSLSSRHAPTDVKCLSSDVDQTVLANHNPVPPCPNNGTISKSSEETSESNGLKVAESTGNAPNDLINNHDDQQTVLTAQICDRIVPEDQECSHKKQDLGSAVLECHPCVAITKLEDLATCGQMNGYGGSNDNMNDLGVDVQKNGVAVFSKVLDSESSCTDKGSNPDGCNDAELSTNHKGTGNVKKHILVPQVTPVKDDVSECEEQKITQPLDSAVLSDENNLNNQNHKNELQSGAEKEVKINSFVLRNIVKDMVKVQSVQVDATYYSETDNPITGSGTAPIVTNQDSVKFSSVELLEPKLSIENSVVAMERKESNVKSVSKADEDAVMKEAGVIEAKRKRIAELSAAVFPTGNHRKSRWAYVLDEMAWLANDFAQERLWKMTAAAQLCHRVAYTSQLRFQDKNRIEEEKRVAHLLSEAVIKFWSSVQDSNKDMPLTCRKNSALTLSQYAVNFLKFNSSCVQHNQAEAPATPDRNSDFGTVDMSCDDNWTENNLFYLVPSGAMKTYRKSIESHVGLYEKSGSILPEDVETSEFDAVTAFGALPNAYEEEEGKTSTYDCDFSKSSGYAQKKRKILRNGHGRRSFEVGDDLMYTQCMENKIRSQQAVIIGKRSATSLNVSIPTKRIRTASRQRVFSPFTSGTSGFVPLPCKTDASSGDTSSFHDDQSTPCGRAIMPNHLEVESERNFEKQLPFDSTGVSKPKKKKKPKHLGSAYEQRWQVDSNFESEQRDHSKKRSEGHQLESNGESVPSPVASQMSNMSPNIKITAGLERGRKTKAKVSTKLQESGTPWSQFEDQALIVLLHDMGPNWELVSDAFNSTLQFKCIFRKPDECKERHMVLRDKTAGNGADSAEDSGSSQPYPSTLPGIPKGSAGQLFQQLQRPMEEETLKSHFEKIIIIVQKQHYRKSQNSNHDPKQLQQPHSSHMLALSKVCPNNLNGGPVLTPLDLCDQTISDPDILSLGYQSPHNNSLPVLNEASVVSMPAPQGPAAMLVGNNFSSSPGSLNPLNPHVRDGRFAIPRSAPLSVDEQQRMQQYNRMLSARNIQQPALTASEPGTDRGMLMLPGVNGMGVMGGVNRCGPVARPRFQAMALPPTLNSGTVHCAGMVTMPNPVNMHSRSSPGQGNSVKRARDALHMMQLSQSQETQPLILAPELQMQTPQANQGLLPYGCSTFPNQTGVPHVPVMSSSLNQRPFAVSSQQPQMLNHRPQFQCANQVSSPQRQAHALRLLKEKQLQQRIRQQQHHQQQQFVSSNAVLPNVQPPAQLPISTSSPNSSQVPPQISSPSVPFSALAPSSSLTSMPHQQKHQMPPHGIVRNSQTGGNGLSNHVSKQRRQPQQQQQQPQQFQPVGRHHPVQPLQPLSQPHTKHVKIVGRGNLIQRSTSIDSCLPNGLPTTPRNNSSERSEHAIRLVQGLAPVSSVCHQSVAPLVTASSNHQQPRLQVQSQDSQKAVNHNPPAPKRVLQASLEVNSDMTTKLEIGESPIDQYNISNNSDPACTMPLTDGASKAMESLVCKQSSQNAPSPVTQTQQPTSPLSQLQLQQLPQTKQLQQQGPVAQAGNNTVYVTPGVSRVG
ncbi:hypothetical protein Leryth_014302 [Lithospermum erythrorhizon]|nr:hypothetical protein Leryth_014302 [Lithospermum erythrorhizon]